MYKKPLNKLNYGNCDISQWEGTLDNRFFSNNISSLKSVNEFWQESSLKISAIQQAEIMYKIFDYGYVFSRKKLC